MNPMLEFPTLPAMVQAGTAPRAAKVSRWMVVFFLLMTVVLGFVPWQQNLPGEGKVVAYAPLERQQTIDTPVEGRVLRWHVIEGTQVKAGDLVAEISDNDPEILDRLLRERDALAQRMRFLEDRERSLGERIQGLDGSRRNALDGAVQRIGMAEERVRQGERAVEGAEATLTAARLNFNRQKQLASRGLASASAFCTADRKRPSSKGLTRKSCAPARIASTARLTEPLAVMAMTRVSGCSVWISCITSSPSRSGRIRSRSTTIGRCMRNCSSPSAALAATATRCPAVARIER